MSDDRELKQCDGCKTIMVSENVWNKTHETLVRQQKQIQALQQDAKAMAESLMCLAEMYSLIRRLELKGKNYNITLGQMYDSIELAQKYASDDVKES